MLICTKNQLRPSLLPLDIAKILQTSYFGYFGYDWPCTPRLMVSTCRIIWYLPACKKSTSSLLSFLRYCKDVTDLLFWVLWACLVMTSKTILPACRRCWCLSSRKKNIFLSTLPWNITKILQICYFGYFGHAKPRPLNAIAPTCRKLWCLSNTKNQLDSSSFLKDPNF